MPRVSVVISVRNRSEMLMDCFRGLARQTLAREQFEVVVIDNCSTEDLSIVFDEARRTLDLPIIDARTRSDNGPAPARNLGVSMARGPVIAFTDSDCRPMPDWLEAGLGGFETEEVAMVSGPVLPKPEQPARFTSKDAFSATDNVTFPTANLFVRRSVFVAMNGFDERLSVRDPFGRANECADTDLAWRIIKSGYQRRFVSEAAVCHEREVLGLLMWMLEPTKLFLLPELVRRHPELRRALLTAGVIFYPRAMFAYAALLLLLAGAWWQPWSLLAIPVVLLLRAIQRTGAIAPLEWLRFMGRAPLNLMRLLLMNLTLLYGSIRFRCLVL